MRSAFQITALLMILFTGFFISAPAQTLDMQQIPGETPRIGIQFDKGFFAKKYDASVASGSFQLSINFRLNSKFNLIGIIPYLNMNYQEFHYYYSIDQIYGVPTPTRSENGIGNIFIGLQSNKAPVNGKRSIVTFGFYLPTVSSNTGYLGSFANYYYNQMFAPHTLGFYFNYAYHKITDKGFTWGIELGPNLYIPTKSRYGRTNLNFHYGLGIGYETKAISLRSEILGLVFLTGSPQSFSDMVAHILDFGATFKGSVVRPKLFYRFYLSDKFDYIIDGSLGVGITVSLK